jgi:hypothetical protein
MFYKGQIDEIAASLENEFAKDGLKIASQYNAIWVVLSNGRFGIEVKMVLMIFILRFKKKILTKLVILI